MVSRFSGPEARLVDAEGKLVTVTQERDVLRASLRAQRGARTKTQKSKRKRIKTQGGPKNGWR